VTKNEAPAAGAFTVNVAEAKPVTAAITLASVPPTIVLVKSSGIPVVSPEPSLMSIVHVIVSKVRDVPGFAVVVEPVHATFEAVVGMPTIVSG